MEAKLYTGNLPGATKEKKLDVLVPQAGDVTAVNIITDRRIGKSQGHAYLTTSAQNEADR